MNFSFQTARIRTAARLCLSFIGLALLAGLFGCSRTASNNYAPNSNGTPSSTVTTTSPGSAPPVSTPLSAEVMNTELKAIEGTTFKLADFKGRVVIVNLWATWCGPCRSEIPDLIKVSEEFKARGVEVIGLTNEDPDSDKEKVKDFVNEFKITYKIGWGDQSFALALMQGQVRNSIPQSFVISRDGRVVKRFVGFNPVETPPKLRQALEDALKM